MVQGTRIVWQTAKSKYLGIWRDMDEQTSNLVEEYFQHGHAYSVIQAKDWRTGGVIQIEVDFRRMTQKIDRVRPIRRILLLAGTA